LNEALAQFRANPKGSASAEDTDHRLAPVGAVR